MRTILAFCTAALMALAGAPLSAQAPAGGAVPRRNGVPDFTGIWVNTPKRGVVPGALDQATGNFRTTSNARNGNKNSVDFERDAGVRQRVFPRERRPWYKPQYWEQVQFNDVNGHSLLAPDPDFLCMPEGVPRIGAPQEIVQTDRHMVFIYPLQIRRVYIDGRAHPPEEHWLGTWLGHSVGTWEGDTLVISTVDFNGLEWLGWPGWFTSPDKRVTERLRRVGNTLTWEAEVTDPILMQPWKPAPQTRTLNVDPQAEFEEPLPCVERDLQHMVTRERG